MINNVMPELTNVVKKTYLYTFVKYGHFLRRALQFCFLQNDINLCCIKELIEPTEPTEWNKYVESDEIRGSSKKKVL